MKAVTHPEIQVTDLVKMTGFTGYTHSINAYNGCSYGCSYCYVRRAFAPDKWGTFVHEKQLIAEQIAAEAIVGKIAIGTDSDPYQPLEKHARATRTILEGLRLHPGVTKVGVFTRSPLVVEDGRLLASLPGARVHFTISPYLEGDRKVLERMNVNNKDRLQALWQLRNIPNLKIVVNVSPSMPILSDRAVEELSTELMRIGVDEVCIGLTKLYTNSKESLYQALAGHPDEQSIKAIWADRGLYTEWRKKYRAMWASAWKSDKPIIWRDTHYRGWEELKTGAPLPKSYYR